MKNIKLEGDELSKISIIVNKYREFETTFTNIQKQLEQLNTENSMLMEQLDKVHEDELLLHTKLEKKYGKGKLDLLTFEYIKK